MRAALTCPSPAQGLPHPCPRACPTRLRAAAGPSLARCCVPSTPVGGPAAAWTDGVDVDTFPLPVLAALAGVFGLLIGSFLNVVIGRVPAGQGLGGRSRCPACRHQIRERDNIPVLSWLLLRGRCRDCAAPIPVRYPAVELGTAAGWALIVAVAGLTPLTPLLLAAFSITVALAVIDLDTMRLPDPLTAALAVLVVAYLTTLTVTTGAWEDYARAWAVAGLLTGFLLVLHLGTGGRGLGFGDVKLAPSLGLLTGFAGWGPAAVGALAPWLLGLLVAGALLVRGRPLRGTAIPFGPLLIAGAWIGVLWGQDLAGWWWGLL